MIQQHTETGAAMAAKATPPVAVAGANFLGYPLPDLVQWVTLIYVSLMASHFAWKWWREIKQAKKDDESAG